MLSGVPLLTSATVLRVCAAEDLMTIVPDRHESGTNLMLLPRQFDRRFRFRYGIDSFRELPVAPRTPPFNEGRMIRDVPHERRVDLVHS